jgi:hypothetical protein
MATNSRDLEDSMSENKSEKHFSPRTTNILLAASVIILIATVLVRFLTTAPQEYVLVAMGVGVFLFLLVAFDQPGEIDGGSNASNGRDS